MDLASAMALAATLWMSLPHGDTGWDLLETVAPFAFTEPMNTGGVLSGVPLKVGGEASSWTQTSFLFGSADLTDPSTGGRPLFYPDLALVGSVHVRSAGLELNAGAPGTVLTIVPKAGGATWSRTVALTSSPPALQAAGFRDLPPVARLRSLARVEATAGGPLRPAIAIFGAAAGTWSSHAERAESFALPGDTRSLMAHPTFALAPDRRAGVTAWVQQTRTAFAGRALLRDRDAAASQSYGGAFAEWATGVERALEINAAFATTKAGPEPPADAIRGSVERLVDGPIESLVESTGGRSSRQSLAATVTTGTRFRMKGGASLSVLRMETSPFGSGLIGETIDGVATRAWDYGFGGESHRTETTQAAFVSLQTALSTNIVLDAGARLEHLRGSARGAASGLAWTSFEPRASLHYARGPWSGSITARRYHPSLALSILAAGDPSGPYGRTFLWTDRNGDNQVQDSERGALIALVGPGSPSQGFSTIDPGVERPYMDELMIAIDLRTSARSSLRFSGVSRRGAALLARYNTGVPFDAYSVRYEFDPGLNLGGDEDDQMLPLYSRPASTFGADRYLLSNTPGVKSTYGGLYLAWLFDASPRWHLLAAATALHSYAPAAFRGYNPSENDEMIVGDAFSDPNSNTFAEGRTLFDRGYGLKVAGSYDAPHRLTISTVGRYADGQNFARLVVVPDLPQGRDIVRAYANGKSKFTFTATWDLRVQKAAAWGSRTVTFAAETYNAINLHNEVEEVTVTGPRWRVPTFAQPPRVIRFSVGVGF